MKRTTKPRDPHSLAGRIRALLAVRPGLTRRQIAEALGADYLDVKLTTEVRRGHLVDRGPTPRRYFVSG